MDDKLNTDHERHDGDWHEWSKDTSPRQRDGSLWPEEGARRLFVRLDADCIIAFTIVDAKVTSENAGARELAGIKHRRLILADEDAEWLRDTLTKAIDAKAAYDGDPTLTPEERAERALERRVQGEARELHPSFEDGFKAGFLAGVKER